MYIFLVIKLLLVYTIAHQIISSRIEIGTKSFRCYEVNKEFIHNCTCKILPNNRTSSLFYANFFMKRTEHISLSLEIFRKTSVQYLPWILRFSVDCCEIVENSNHEKLRNPAIRIIVDVFRLAYPSVFVSGCPYEGQYESTKADLNTLISPLLPPMFPAGNFKFALHFYETMSNKTIFKTDVELVFKQESSPWIL